MSYTNVWNDTTPTGSEAANTIDDIFRSLKVDIEQRLTDIWGMPNFTDDPLRPYGLKFTDVQDAVIRFGDNAGTPRAIIFKDKTATNTYLTINSTEIYPNSTYALGDSSHTFASLYVEKVVLGSTAKLLGDSVNGFLFRNAADNATLVSISQAGAVTILSGLTITSGNVLVGSGTFTVNSSTSFGSATANNVVTSQGANGNYLYRWLNAAGTQSAGSYLSNSGADLSFNVNSNVFTFSATGSLAVPSGLTVSAGISSFAGLVNVNPSAATSSALQFYVGATRCGGVGLSSWAFGDGLNDFSLWADIGKPIKFGAGVGGGQSGLITGGVFAWGTTSTGSGGFYAAAGDIQIANATRLRGLATGGNSYRLIGIDTNNAVRIDQDGLGAVFGGSIQLGVAYAAGAPAATGYVTLKDSTGTTYKVLVST